MLMKLFTSLLPSITPQTTKLHLAQASITSSRTEHPMDVYLAGEFDNWQAWQSKKNFERDFLIGLVEIPSTNRWLLAGVYDSLVAREDPKGGRSSAVIYDYRRIPEFAQLDGRLIVEYEKTSRPNYRRLETCIATMTLSAILEKKMTVGKFPGFKELDISHRELKIIVRHGLESWQTALSSVAGVYLISDRTVGEHQLYVGSATGTGGLWDRWCTYAKNGHGDNVRLRELFNKRGAAFAENFRFSILEIADKHTSIDEIMLREIHWKRRLLTRDSGLNGN